MSEQPSTDVAAVETPQVVEHRGHLSEQMRYAQALAAAGLLPPAYRRQPANVLLAMEYAKALNIPVMTAIQGVHVIDGKPSASAGLISALVRKAGHRLRVTGDDTRAVCEIVRHDDPDFTFRAEWTLDRAKAAKLLGKGTWQQYPSAMLKARAITECARDACPEALSGVAYTPEELGDDDVSSFTEETSGAVHPEATFDVSGAAPESGIEDAVVVEETPDAGDGAGEGPSPASRFTGPDDPRLTRRYGTPNATAGKAAITRLILAMADAGIPRDDRDANLAWCVERIGRDIETRNDLTSAEVGYLLDILRPGAT